MRVLKVHYIIDTGDQGKDDYVLDEIEKGLKFQRKMIPDKVLMLIGDEIVSEKV